MTRPLAVFLLASAPFTARADFSGCPTPTPQPIPPVFYFSPPDGGAGVATNAAIIFQPVTAVQVMIATSGNSPALAIGTDHFVGPLDLFHLTSALKPSTTYQVSLVGPGNNTPFETATFTTGGSGDNGTPILPGSAQVTVGAFVPDNTNPDCPNPPEYAIDVSWPAATEAGQSAFTYLVIATDALGTPESFSGGGYGGDSQPESQPGGVLGLARAGTAMSVTVYAFDQAGNQDSASSTDAIPAALGGGGSHRGCSVALDSSGAVGGLLAAILLLGIFRIRRVRAPD